jgi:iron complex outermembrane recepter protein
MVLKPIPSVAAYATYMEGISAGGTAPSTAKNAGDMLEPSASSQWEFGLKSTLFNCLDLMVAYYHTNKINEYTDPSDNIYKQDGRQLHQGVELTGTGKIYNVLTIGASATSLSAEVKRAKTNTAIEGKTPINIPEKQARGYLEIEIPRVKGLVVTAGLNYYGRRPVDAANLAYTQSAITGDAGLRYSSTLMGHGTTITLNVLNVTNEYFWGGYLDGCGLMQGDPRTMSLKIKLLL